MAKRSAKKTGARATATRERRPIGSTANKKVLSKKQRIGSRSPLVSAGKTSRSSSVAAKSAKATKAKREPKTKAAVIPASPPVHVLIRVRSEDGATISEHYRVLEQHGRALIGKVGKALGSGLMEELNRQIAGGAETYLFLTIKNGWRGASYTTYLCGLEAVHATLLPDKRKFVPTYYESAYEGIGSWFEITSMYELDSDQMNRIEVVSSGRSIMSVIKSMAVVFKVRMT